MRLRIRRLSIELGKLALVAALVVLMVQATPREWLLFVAVFAAGWILAELFWPAAARWFRGSSPWQGVICLGALTCIYLAKTDMLPDALREPVAWAGTLLFIALLLLTRRRRPRPAAEASGSLAA